MLLWPGNCEEHRVKGSINIKFTVDASWRHVSIYKFKVLKFSGTILTFTITSAMAEIKQSFTELKLQQFYWLTLQFEISIILLYYRSVSAHVRTLRTRKGYLEVLSASRLSNNTYLHIITPLAWGGPSASRQK